MTSIPPIMRLADNVVMLTGPGVAALQYCIQTTIAARHRNGLPASNDLARMLEAASPTGPTDQPNPGDPQAEDVTEWLSTNQVAALLQVSPRQARRLGKRIGGQLIAGRYAFDKHTITEHIEGRKAA